MRYKKANIIKIKDRIKGATSRSPNGAWLQVTIIATHIEHSVVCLHVVCVCVCVCVGAFGTPVNPAKTDVLVVSRSGRLTHMGQRNHALVGGPCSEGEHVPDTPWTTVSSSLLSRRTLPIIAHSTERSVRCGLSLPLLQQLIFIAVASK